MGNHDEFLIDPALIDAYTEQTPVIEAVEWCRGELGREDLDFVRGFERTRRIRLDDRSTLLVFHGSPRSHMDDILATTGADELDELLADHVATVMAGGHTHVQMLRQHRGTLLVNPGSVGLPFKEYMAGRAPTLLAHAEYAIVEAAGGRVSVSLHRVPLDPADLARRRRRRAMCRYAIFSCSNTADSFNQSIEDLPPWFERWSMPSRSCRAAMRAGFRFVTARGEERYYPYEALEREARRRAAKLAQLGLQKGERIALVIADPEEFVLSFLGAAVAGLVAVPIHPRVSFNFKTRQSYAETVSHIVRSAGARMLLTLASTREAIEGALAPDTGLERILVVEEFLAGEAPAFEFPAGEPGGPLLPAVHLRQHLASEGRDGHPRQPRRQRRSVPRAEGRGPAPRRRRDQLVAAVSRHGADRLRPRHADLRPPHGTARDGGVRAPARGLDGGDEQVRGHHHVRAQLRLCARRATHARRGSRRPGPQPAARRGLRRRADQRGRDASVLRALRRGRLSPRSAVAVLRHGRGDARDHVPRSRPADRHRHASMPRHWASARPCRRSRHAELRTVELVGCGHAFPGHELRIVDESGRPLPERCVGEIITPRTEHHGRLLRAVRSDRGERLPRRLVAHRRPRLHRRRPALHLRPQQGSHHHPRRELLSAGHRVGGGGSARRPAQRGRCLQRHARRRGKP